MDQSPQPRILILTDQCISWSHGIGAVLIRHFKFFPQEQVFHAFIDYRGEPYFSQSCRVKAQRPLVTVLSDIRRGRNRGKPGISVREFVREHLNGDHPVDLVYSNVFGDTGLAILEGLVSRPALDVPVIHHVHDIICVRPKRFEALLRRLSPQVAEFWAIGPALAEEVERITGRETLLMNTFPSDIAPTFKREHREFSGDAKVVMLGNCHMAHVLESLRRVWAEVQAKTPGLGPIQWYAHPTSVDYVHRQGAAVAPEIQYAGFLPNNELHQALCEADFAIVPFNLADEPESSYARYSIPSRLAEFSNAGLPVIAAAGRETDAARFIKGNGLGVCASLDSPAEFGNLLLQFTADVELRKNLGRRARRFAEEKLDVRAYRERLEERFRAVTGLSFALSEQNAGGA